MPPREKQNYINNKDLYDALTAYLLACSTAEELGKPLPIVPQYIAESIFSIATRLARRPNFSEYSYKDDMIMDGVENCLQYIRNFNPEKYKNPFAYFTQIIWYAFLRRIQKEKKEMYIRYKSSHRLLSEGGTYDSEEIQLHLNTSADYIEDFVATYEEKMTANKNKAKKIVDKA
jgi:hypothetical protein